MNNKSKIRGILIAFLILGVSIGYVYFVPKVKYQGKSLTAGILDSIPSKTQNWRGKDARSQNLDLDDEIYGFISRIFAKQYTNIDNSGENLALVVLDAGNFHYPKVCFTGAGFKTEELLQRELNLQSGKIKAHLMLSEKKGARILSVYWICIDKEIIPTWVEQKVKQFFYSLFSKKKVGLMVRVDVSVFKNIDESLALTENFLNDIYQGVPGEYREYIFGLN